MKIPYIVNYMKEIPLQPSAILIYDNKTQINYLDVDFKFKAVSINYGPQTTTLTETSENADNEGIYVGPESTLFTDSVENSDLNYYGPDSSTEKTTTRGNSVKIGRFLGPDTTIRTFTVEQGDENENVIFLGPDTTTETRSTENSDTH
ncbi:hypothetical protein [Rummeliibacillus sp. TYF-LIM-RU47]|uniref:hypothetical protein n=1 Tax=Rummeliibacillus sp. TYF-LIM-RU47 TaxID=2608406 RepID=UPI00123B8C9F|nr:hypothetical protein [Rummeliibacillus sp. TYF-LIM-RU47]